jgi:hypothetical protein
LLVIDIGRHLVLTMNNKRLSRRKRYYNELVRRMEACARKYPRSIIAIDSGTFKIVAHGKTIKIMMRQLKGQQLRGIPVIFRQDHSKNWVLSLT